MYVFPLKCSAHVSWQINHFKEFDNAKKYLAYVCSIGVMQ